MSERIHALAKQLFGRPSLDDCSLEEVKRLAERYPYFAPAQFLLLEKLKIPGGEDHAAQFRKAVLYYHDPLQFEQFLSSGRFHTAGMDPDFSEETAVPLPHPLPVGSETQSEDKAIAEEILQPDEDLKPEETMPEERPVEASGEDAAIAEEILQTEEEPLAATQPAVETGWQAASVPGEAHAETNLPAPAPPGPALPPSAPATEPALSFEPFHTVDYFASQGIRLSQEEAGTDRVGKQLKSFTEWLKTMKKLPTAERNAQLDQGSEKAVVTLAEGSVHDSSVVTEAMAEVWLKQGKSEKAAEVYQKLSLLNPSKKAYFAAKIDQLKRS